MRRSLLAAAAITALIVLYLVAVSGRALTLVGTGEPVAVGLGVAVLVIPLLGVWLLVREWTLAVRVQAMADELAAAGRLPVDDLPRTPGGRIQRDAADQAFARARDDVERSPDDWEAWFRLGFAYDAARDRRRARQALRTAVARRRAAPG